MIQQEQEQEQKLIVRARAERRRLLQLFSSPNGDQVLRDLERRFETDLPVFQGKAGAYDPLDAMRRDAHREVFLVIRRMLEIAQTETNTDKSAQSND